jgi:hypothetical protein
MNTFNIFFSEFWVPFACAAPIFALLQLGRRLSLAGSAAVFIRPASFQELCSFSKEEQKRLLHEADKEAFPRWRFFCPVLIYAVLFSAGAAFGRTLLKVAALPDSVWVSAGLAGLSVALLAWLASRLEVRCIRPFLKVQIAKTRNAT